MTGVSTSGSELAPAKVNLVLRVGEPRPDGLHPIASLFARLDLADTVSLETGLEADSVRCPGVETGPNLVSAAVAAWRAAGLPDPGGVRIEIDKRIPVAAGLGGGSADAAAVLRLLRELSGADVDDLALREIAVRVGADVPSQIAPAAAVVTGVGEQVDRVDLAPLALVLVPAEEGLATPAVYGELDRLRAAGELPPVEPLDPAALHGLARAPASSVAGATENDLEPAALSLRPELAETLSALTGHGALAARISGSGPTAFGIFPDVATAERAAGAIAGALTAIAR